jgi:hypothetical protein
LGLLSSVLAIGKTLNIAGNGYSTGWEALAIPIVAVDLQYRERGGATSYATTLSLSNRRAPFSGAAFQRPAMVGAPFGSASGGIDWAHGLAETSGQADEARGLASQFGGAHESRAPGDTLDATAPSAGFGGGGDLGIATPDQFGLSFEGRGNNFKSDGSNRNLLENGGSTVHRQTSDDIAANIARGNQQEDFEA